MKLSSSNKAIVGILVLAALAIGFWVLLLSPKREEASKLTDQADQLRASLAESQRQVTEAEAARREFPEDYQRLVVLGQAVPSNEETSSLLVELSRVARQANVRFEGIELESSGEESAAEPATEVAPPEAAGATGVPASATIPPTEAAASLLPLGATIGPAGLGVMPYKLSFSGSFTQIADFIAGVDSMVGGSGEQVAVEGRLVTLDGFALTEEQQRGYPYLEATFSVTTYLTPPEQSTAAAAAVPAESGAAPAAVESSEPSEPAAESPTTVAEAR